MRFKEGVVRVNGQINDAGERVAYAKTEAGTREIILMGRLSTALKEARIASRFSRPDDYVIASDTGTPMDGRNLTKRALREPCKGTDLADVCFYVLRHTFASILIGHGSDPLFVADQMGHESPSFTLDRYGHLFNRARHAAEHRAKLDAEFGRLFG